MHMQIPYFLVYKYGNGNGHIILVVKLVMKKTLRIRIKFIESDIQDKEQFLPVIFKPFVVAIFIITTTFVIPSFFFPFLIFVFLKL